MRLSPASEKLENNLKGELEYPDEPDWMVGLREKLYYKIELLQSNVTG